MVSRYQFAMALTSSAIVWWEMRANGPSGGKKGVLRFNMYRDGEDRLIWRVKWRKKKMDGRELVDSPGLGKDNANLRERRTGWRGVCRDNEYSAPALHKYFLHAKWTY